MNNQRGMAVALVLLILSVVSLLGTGLMVQSMMSTRFTSAQKNYDKMFNLAEGGAAFAFNKISVMDVASYDVEAVMYAVGSNSRITVGEWSASVIMRGYSTNPQDLPGWELGAEGGYHLEFWNAEGLGSRAAAGTIAQSAVDVGVSKVARN